MEMLSELHAGGATVCLATHNPDYIARAQRHIYLFDGRVMAEPVGGTSVTCYVPRCQVQRANVPALSARRRAICQSATCWRRTF